MEICDQCGIRRWEEEKILCNNITCKGRAWPYSLLLANPIKINLKVYRVRNLVPIFHHFREAWTHCFRCFWICLRFWYQEKLTIFLMTPGGFYSWNIYRLEDINKLWPIMVTIIKIIAHSKVLCYVISSCIQKISLQF